jgi:hypothetical protein
MPSRAGPPHPHHAAPDPSTDFEAIGRHAAGVDFPWDTRRAYELALLKTFAVPTSSRLLAATGEFTERTAKRHDDTVAIVATLGLHGLDSPQGRRALRIMNQAHAAYRIPPEEYRYTLARFVLEPIEWNNHYGWRPLAEYEKQAGFHFWMEVGRRMAIPDLPGTLRDLTRESEAFERTHVAFDPANRRLLDAVLTSRTKPWGAAGRKAAQTVVAALLDDRYRTAFGLNPPPQPVRLTLNHSLKAKAALVARLPRRQTPVPLPRLKTYPEGIDWERVGPRRAETEKTT